MNLQPGVNIVSPALRRASIIAMSLMITSSIAGFTSFSNFSNFSTIQAAFAQDEGTIADKGKARMSHGDWDGAIDAFTEALALSSEDSKIRFLRGQCFFHLKNYALAMSDFDTIIQATPDNSDAFLWRGTTRSKLGNDDLAVSDFIQAAKLQPVLAKNYFEAKPEELSSPSNISTSGGKRISQHAQDEHTVALYKKAMDRAYPDGYKSIALSPDSVVLPVVPGSITSGATDSSTKIVEKKNKHKNQSKDSSRDQSLDLVSLGSTDANHEAKLEKAKKAISEYSDSLRQNPSSADSAENYFHRGRAYQRLNNFDSAISDYTKAINLSPQTSLFYLARASVYVLLKKPLMVKADIENARAVDPTVPENPELNLER